MKMLSSNRPNYSEQIIPIFILKNEFIKVFFAIIQLEKLTSVIDFFL